MRILNIPFCIFLFIIFTNNLFGQSLYKDSKALAQLKSQLVETQREVALLEFEQAQVNSQLGNAPLSVLLKVKLGNIGNRISVSRDSSRKYSGEILAILEHYWGRPSGFKESQITALPSKLWKNYNENQSLAPLLASVKLTIDTSGGILQKAYLARKDSLRSSVKREKIISLLNSQYAKSPLEYLSVSRTLQDYQQPPLSSIKFMEASAEASNKNINNGIFNQQAIIIGLFNFLIERAQEEVVITFLERLLGKNGIQQFRELFPGTSSAFGDLDFTYSESFLERLRDAFYRDIQLLSVSLPSLLTNEDYFQLLDSDPIAYNFLQLYSMVAMGQQGVPLTEIVPLTFRNLYDRYEDEKKTINLKIANEYHTYEEYKVLSGTTRKLLKEVEDITSVLDKFQQGTMTKFQKLFSAALTVNQDTIEEKISIKGDINILKEEGKKVFFDLFADKKPDSSPELVEKRIDIYTKLKDIRNPDFDLLKSALTKEYTKFSSKASISIQGNLSGVDKKKQANFWKLLAQKPPDSTADIKTKSVQVLVALNKKFPPLAGEPDNFPLDTIQKYHQLVPLQHQAKLKIVRLNDQITNDILFMIGTIENVPITDISKFIQPVASESTSPISKAKSKILQDIIESASLIPSHQKKLGIIVSPKYVHLSGQPIDIQRVRLDQLAASNTIKLPADSIPYLDAGYQGILPILKNTEDYSLLMLPSLLEAELDPEIVKTWSTLKTYDKFLRNPLSDQQLRAAGLALTRKLNDPWYDDMSIVQMLRQWQQDVTDYRYELQRWNDEVFPEVKETRDLAEYKKKLSELKEVITQTKGHFQDSLGSLNAAPLDVLYKILSDDIFNGELTKAQASLVQAGEAELYAVEERLIELHRKLASTFPDKAEGSPFEAYMAGKDTLDDLQGVLYKIDDLESLLLQLEEQLFLLDRNTASQEVQALRSISPIVQITESLSHIMYCLQDAGPKGGWLNKDQLNDVFVNEEVTPIFMGLLSQQLSQVKVKGSFAVNGLMDLVKLTVQDLEFMAVKEITTDSIDLSFSRKATFINLTLNRLLELPLFIDQLWPDKALSLIQMYPELEPIPDLSDQALDFIQYTNKRDHRHAMSSLIRLFTQIIDVVEERRIAAANKPKEITAKGTTAAVKVKATPLTAEQILQKKQRRKKTTKALAFLKKYGDFMADMIDADSSKQVQALLDGIADRPGGSRFKRREPFTANINGYVGGLIGRETLKGKALTKKEQFASFAPTIPVGLSFSKMTGKGKKAQSFSLFLSILDLGSLTTFSFDSEIEGENQFSFKNIVKPGLQLHWNIKNSPFFLGVGSQWGPQFREFDGEQKQLNSARIFFNFGVDVVIKQLY